MGLFHARFHSDYPSATYHRAKAFSINPIGCLLPSQIPSCGLHILARAKEKTQLNAHEPSALTSSDARRLCVEAAAAHGLVCRASLLHAPARGIGRAARGPARAAPT